MLRRIPRTGSQAGMAGADSPVFPLADHPVRRAVPAQASVRVAPTLCDSPLLQILSRSLSPGPGAHHGHCGDLATSEVMPCRTRDGPDRGGKAKECPFVSATDHSFAVAPVAAGDRELQ